MNLRSILFLLALVTCAQVEASPFGLKFLHKGAPSTAVLYDTSIGDGTVDTNGFAGLPLRVGDHAYFLNSSTGSDANTCAAAQSSATPKATVSSVMACTADGHGDHILVAEGTTYTTAPPDFSFLTGGFSYAYPFVVESYDPTDPTNTAKYGHATGSGSHARPIFQHTLNWQGGTGQSYIALRGVDINPGNIADQFNQLLDVGSGLLFENDLFRYSGLILKINKQTSVGQHWIVRNSSIFSEWGGGQINGLYVSGGWPITVEDSVLYHNGWKEGGLGRDDATQGANGFTHPLYIQHTTKIISRRNLIADGSADCGSYRDDTIIQNNVYLYCPIALSAGGGNNSPEASPWGDALDVAANAVLNGNDLNTTNTRGWGIDTDNGKTFSTARYNVLAHNIGTGPNQTFSVDARTDGELSHMLFDHNISYLWSSSGGTYVARDVTAHDFATFTNNIWDDPASGSNINRSSATFPNSALDAPALATGAGYASYTAMMQYAELNPEAHIQRTLRPTIMSAYGQTGPPLTDLGIDFTDWRTGNLELAAIVGTQPESTLTLGGTWPTGFTIDSNTRFYKLDGTQTAGSGTGTIIETPNGGGSTHTTTVNWTVSTAPQLSSLSVSGITSTTATINVTTDTGNGTLYYVLDDLGDGDCVVGYCPALLPGVVKGAVSYNYYTFVKSGSAAVSASGARTISLTGLTSGKDYWVSVMQVSGGGVYSPTTNGMHALGPVHFVTP